MIQNIWAVGRNYADHAKELGNRVPEPTSEPMIFLKAGSGIVSNGETFHLPQFSEDVHHEVEVAFRFGKNLELTEFTLAIDLTARDVQERLKAKGQPWTLAKSFRASCLLGPIHPFSPADLDLRNIEFNLSVNGVLRQSGSTADMIHSVESLKNYVINRFPVTEGDLLITGTPAGVARLKPGDILSAEIPGQLQANWRIATQVAP